MKTAETQGIVYTPQPIVDFMCASAEELLNGELGLTLDSASAHILDPCTGIFARSHAPLGLSSKVAAGRRSNSGLPYQSKKRRFGHFPIENH